MRKISNNQNNKKGVTTRTIDINDIYDEMKAAISKRVYYQKQQEILAKKVKRSGVSMSKQIDDVMVNIGKCTHKINCLISKLCKYRKTHKAMKLAYDYLGNEIDRINNIIVKQNELIFDVKSGKSAVINSFGVMSTDISSLIKYISNKEKQLKKLEAWKNYVSNYVDLDVRKIVDKRISYYNKMYNIKTKMKVPMGNNNTSFDHRSYYNMMYNIKTN